MWQILFNILLVLLGCIALLAGIIVIVWLLVYLFPMSEEPEKPPPPRSAVED